MKYLEKVIPQGAYCYTPDLDDIKDLNTIGYKIKPCPFNKWETPLVSYCKLLREEIMDQCKICNINNHD